MPTETEALDDIRKAWDGHVALVTKALDKIAKLSTPPVSVDNADAIEAWAAKIIESNAAMSAVLDPLDPTTDTPPVPTDGGAPTDSGDSADGGVA